MSEFPSFPFQTTTGVQDRFMWHSSSCATRSTTGVVGCQVLMMFSSAVQYQASGTDVPCVFGTMFFTLHQMTMTLFRISQPYSAIATYSAGHGVVPAGIRLHMCMWYLQSSSFKHFVYVPGQSS